MDKKRFRELERLCKRGWMEMAETGCDKPDYLEGFRHRCPACEISMRVSGGSAQDCRYCPIIVWRGENLSTEHMIPANCQYPGNAYRDWYVAHDYVEDTVAAKRAALKIAKYSWMWMPEYADVYI